MRDREPWRFAVGQWDCSIDLVADLGLEEDNAKHLSRGTIE